jgi:hypothetical protein
MGKYLLAFYLLPPPLPIALLFTYITTSEKLVKLRKPLEISKNIKNLYFDIPKKILCMIPWIDDRENK